MPLPPTERARASGSVKLSLRPQDILLYAQRPDREPSALAVEVRERTYLGESWQYVVAPDGGGPSLSVTASPQTLLASGDRVWAVLDLARAVVLRS
jgi:iron(III) transport system ATP-binding protein